MTLLQFVIFSILLFLQIQIPNSEALTEAPLPTTRGTTTHNPNITFCTTSCLNFAFCDNGNCRCLFGDRYQYLSGYCSCDINLDISRICGTDTICNEDTNQCECKEGYELNIGSGICETQIESWFWKLAIYLSFLCGPFTCCCFCCCNCCGQLSKKKSRRTSLLPQQAQIPQRPLPSIQLEMIQIQAPSPPAVAPSSADQPPPPYTAVVGQTKFPPVSYLTSEA